MTVNYHIIQSSPAPCDVIFSLISTKLDSQESVVFALFQDILKTKADSVGEREGAIGTPLVF